MGRDISLLDQARIASPCTASWSEMKGDDRVRFCSQCSLHVYNFAELTRAEGERLIETTEGRLCGVLYRRPDGTVLTKDCPRGLEAARRKLARGLLWLNGVAAAFIGMIVGLTGIHASPRLRNLEPFARVCHWLAPKLPLPTPGRLAGAIARPLPSNLPITPRTGNLTPLPASSR